MLRVFSDLQKPRVEFGSAAERGSYTLVRVTTNASSCARARSRDSVPLHVLLLNTDAPLLLLLSWAARDRP